jgi:hypothetical protein
MNIFLVLEQQQSTTLDHVGRTDPILNETIIGAVNESMKSGKEVEKLTFLFRFEPVWKQCHEFISINNAHSETIHAKLCSIFQKRCNAASVW